MAASCVWNRRAHHATAAIARAHKAHREAWSRIADVLAGTDDLEIRQAARARAGEIMLARSEAAARHAEMWQMIERLSNATACPDNVSSVEWLLGLGLIEADGVTYTPTPKAELRVVGKDSP